MCAGVGPEEEAVVQLTQYFNGIIESIVAKTFLHYAKSKSKNEKKGPGYFDFQKMEKTKIVDMSPRCFLLQPSSLQNRLKESRDKLITSFRNFEFGAYNPVISECFGVDAILHPGSGIEALFPPRPPGRPKKIRLEAQKDNKASSTARVLDIIGQATDSKTKEIYVLVHWDNSTKDDDITWTFLRDLSPSTLSWWVSESERRFPI